MKKLFFIALVAIGFSANAQISIGAKAGVNLSNFTGSTFDQFKKSTKVNYYIGGYVDFWLSNNVALQPEALLSVQGAKFDTAKLNLTYLNVPVLLKFKADGGFYFEVGPQFGFKIGESSDFGNLPAKDLVKTFDFSGAVGLGYQVSGTFGIGARYVLGFSKLGNADFSNPDFKNSNIQIGIFVGLGGPSGKKS